MDDLASKRDGRTVYRHIIGGRDADAPDGAALDVLSPIDGQPFAAIPAGTAADIDAAVAAGQRRDVRLKTQVPVAWVYLTGFATADGTVHFRDDVYGLDRPDAPPLPQPAADDLVTSSIKKPAL